MSEENKFIAPANVHEQLQKTAATYRKQLITMPTKGLKKSLSYMTLRPGIRVSETVGELTGNAEIGPYDENRTADSGAKITSRTLEVFLGNVDVKFSPNSVYSTIWGANVMSGDALKNVQSRSPDYNQTYFQGTRNIAIGGNAGCTQSDETSVLFNLRTGCAGHGRKGNSGRCRREDPAVCAMRIGCRTDEE